MLEIIKHHRQNVTSNLPDSSKTIPLALDRYVAASLLQKAIRRSENLLARSAAKHLFLNDQVRLWRRLAVILFEDIGIHDIDLSLDLLSCAPRKGFQWVSWETVSALVDRLCDAPKTQIANHLIHLAIFDNEERAPINHLQAKTFNDAFETVLDGQHSLVQKTLVGWALAGPSLSLHSPVKYPGGDMTRLMDELSFWAQSICLYTILHEGIRMTRLPLPLAAVIEFKSRGAPVQKSPTAADQRPDQNVIDNVPTWAFDQYTRVGKSSLRIFARQSEDVANVLNSLTTSKQLQLSELYSTHFEIESAAIAKRHPDNVWLEFLGRVRSIGPARRPSTWIALDTAIRRNWLEFEDVRLAEIRSASYG